MSDARAALARALGDAYAIERELGGGGMSRVFLAREVALGREVVVKVLAPELASTLSAERFAREIRLVAALQEPHIVPVLAAGATDDGTAWFTMPWVAGESLRQRLARGPVPVGEALGILRNVAQALAYAHARGIVHRDIKPENVLLSNGTAMVADFGIAKAVTAARTDPGAGALTGTGMAVGTPAYMSPEQATGDPATDHRTDIYAWGVIAYELLAGRHPFADKGTPSALVAAHLTEAPATFTAAGVAPATRTLVLQCLAKEAAARPATMDDVLARLGAGTGDAVAGAPATRWPRAPYVVLVAGTIVIAAVGAFLWRARAGAAPPAFERLAVLPMDNQTGDTALRYLADGMTREVIGVLSDAGVRVLGHRAVASYHGTAMPVKQVASDLGVDVVATGAVLRAGETIEVAAELSDPRTGEALWSRTFTRPAADVVTLQRELAAEIARGIRARLTPQQVQAFAPARAVNPRAYAQYLLGAEQANLRTPESFPRAIAHLRQAMALDSTFAPAYATYAMANAYGLIYQLTPRDSGRRAVEWGATRAMALDSTLGDAWLARGVARAHVDWDFAGADADFAAGLKRPHTRLAEGLHMWTLWATGRPRQARRVAQSLIDAEPTTAQWRSDISWSLWTLGDTAEARRQLTRATEVDSTFFEAHDLFGMVEADAHNLEPSARRHATAVRMAGGTYWTQWFSEVVLHVARGDTARAKAVLHRLEGDPRLAQRGFMALHVGLADSAFVLFGRAVTERDPDLLWTLASVPYVRRLRTDPRYQALLSRVGLRLEDGS